MLPNDPLGLVGLDDGVDALVQVPQGEKGIRFLAARPAAVTPVLTLDSPRP